MRVKSFFISFLFVLQIQPPAQTLTLEDFRDMADFLNAPNFKDILKAQKAEAKRKEKLLK